VSSRLSASLERTLHSRSSIVRQGMRGCGKARRIEDYRKDRLSLLVSEIILYFFNFFVDDVAFGVDSCTEGRGRMLRLAV